MIKVGNVYTCNIADKVINYNFNSQFFRYKGLFFFLFLLKQHLLLLLLSKPRKGKITFNFNFLGLRVAENDLFL